MENNSRSKIYNPEKLVNFKELINKINTLYPDNIAFKYKKTPQDKVCIEKTYSTFYNDINKLGTSLFDLGLKDKRIAIIAPNRYEWCVSYLAVTCGNMTVVPLDKSLPAGELEQSIYRCDADCIIFADKYLDTIKKVKSDNKSSLKHYICFDFSENSDGILSYSKLIEKGEELLSSGAKDYLNQEIDEKKMSIMLFTSATTSISKIVCLSQANICANIYQIGCIFGASSGETFLSFLPLHHTFESSTTFLYGLTRGITIAFCDGLKYIGKNLKEYNVAGFVCVPLILDAMYKKVKKGIEKSGKEKSFNIMTKICNFLLKFGIDIRRKVFKSILDEIDGNLRVVVCGAAPISKDTAIGFSNLGINLINGYGLTETSPVVAAENDKYKRPGSVAFPLPEIEVKIDNPNESGIGEILVKGPNVMLGYYNDEKATKEALQDGWFHSGDLGYFDKDGYLYITGRQKSVIVLKNGKNIFPEELEMLIAQFPYVEENLIYGRPTDDGDLDIASKIVYKKDIMKELYPNEPESNYHSLIWQDIKKINKTMPPYKYIKHLILTEEPLIKTTTAKVKRHEEIKKILAEMK